MKPRRSVGAAITLICLATSLQPLAGVEYTIEPGDALWNIATAYEVSVDDLVSANALSDPDLIIVGSTITIPDGAATAATPVASAARTHVVQAGDSLWAIAARYAVPLGLLARHNDIGGEAVIFPEQVLELPAADATSAGDPNSTVATAAQRHTVAEGDSLWAIATKYSVGIDTLAASNALTLESVLQIGYSLRIPGSGSDLAQLPTDLRDDPGRLALMPVFDKWAAEYAVPADLLKALAWFESGWNNEKRSSADAIGIGQLLPITADFVSEVLLRGEILDPHVPEENIQLSARYLRYLLDNAGSVRLAVASYYQGLTATRHHGVYQSSEFYVQGILAMRSRFG